MAKPLLKFLAALSAVVAMGTAQSTTITYEDVFGGVAMGGFLQSPGVSISNNVPGSFLEAAFTGGLPLFDPALGTLRHVTIGVSTTSVLGAAVFNLPDSYITVSDLTYYLDATNSTRGTLSSQGSAWVSIPGGSLGSNDLRGSEVLSPVLTDNVRFFGFTTPAEGTLKGSGEPYWNEAAGGPWMANTSITFSGSQSYLSSDISQFIGIGEFPVTSDASTRLTWARDLRYEHDVFLALINAIVSAKVTVEYQYGTPYEDFQLRVPFGFGDPPTAGLPPGIGGITPSTDDPQLWSYYMPTGTSVPEPATLALLGLGLAGLGFSRRKQ